MKKHLLLFKTLIIACLAMVAGGGISVAAEVTDVLVASKFAATTTNYKDFSGVTFSSSAVYAGNTAYNSGNIQLRSKSNSGIVSTKSGGKIAKIIVTWDNSTSQGRTLDIYGKNSAYETGADLYNSSTQGTKLGSIVKGKSTELEISGDYEYIGLRSKKDAMYLTKVEVVWSAYSNIKELKDYAIKDESVTLSLDDAQVVYANDKNVFVRDASGAICFYNTGLDIKQNDILNGTIKGKFSVSYGMPQLIKDGTNTNADNLTITAGEAAQPKDLTHGSFADYTCDLVKVSKGVVDDNGTDVKLMNQDVEYAVFYDKFEINYTKPFNSAAVDVTGIVIPYVANDPTETIIRIAPTNKYDIVYRFSENDGTATVGAVGDAKVAIERTLSSDYWNTLCLPFSLTAEQITATFGEGTLITEFSDVEGSVMTFTNATSIEAGKPYLFKPAKTVVNPVFEGVAITSEGAKMVKAPTNGNYAFIGTYSKYKMATDKSEVFITTSGKLSYPAEDTNTIKGMRAFIQLPTTANAKAFNLNIGGEATSIDTIDGGLFNGNATIYNLNGQKMSSDINGLAKGLYIVNGKKMIVK